MRAPYIRSVHMLCEHQQQWQHGRHAMPFGLRSQRCLPRRASCSPECVPFACVLDCIALEMENHMRKLNRPSSGGGGGARAFGVRSPSGGGGRRGRRTGGTQRGEGGVGREARKGAKGASHGGRRRAVEANERVSEAARRQGAAEQ